MNLYMILPCILSITLLDASSQDKSPCVPPEESVLIAQTGIYAQMNRENKSSKETHSHTTSFRSSDDGTPMFNVLFDLIQRNQAEMRKENKYNSLPSEKK